LWCVIVAVCHQGNISARENPSLNIYSSDVLTRTRCLIDVCIQIRKCNILNERFEHIRALLDISATDCSNNET